MKRTVLPEYVYPARRKNLKIVIFRKVPGITAQVKAGVQEIGEGVRRWVNEGILPGAEEVQVNEPSQLIQIIPTKGVPSRGSLPYDIKMFLEYVSKFTSKGSRLAGAETSESFFDLADRLIREILESFNNPFTIEKVEGITLKLAGEEVTLDEAKKELWEAAQFLNPFGMADAGYGRRDHGEEHSFADTWRDRSGNR